MADIAPSVLANSVMAKMYDVLTNGDSTVPKSADNFFSWFTPGIPMDPEDFEFLTQGLTGVVKPAAVAALVVPGSPAGAAPPAAGAAPASGSGTLSGGQVLTPDLINQLRAADTNRVYMQAEMISQLFDFVPDVVTGTNKQFAQFSVSNNEGTLSDRYAMLLKMSQVMSQELDDATKAKIAKFRALEQTTTQHKDLVTDEVTEVSGPSPLMQAYNTKLSAYNSAALTYNSARIAALAANDPAAVQNWAINASILRDTVRAAMDDWQTNGYKTDVEEIAAYIAQVQQRDMKLLKAEYEDDLARATLTGISSGTDFFYTALIPGDFATSTGWSGFTFSSGDISSYRHSSSNASGFAAQGGGSFLGMFGGSGSASGSSSTVQSNSTFNMDRFSLSFEIAQVMIHRSWFKEAFVVSKSWRFDPSVPDVKGRWVSDGATPPQGLIPAYPTTAVFIRNLRLGIDKNSSAGQFIQHQQQSAQGGGGFAAIGPIFLGGSATHYSKSGYTNRNYQASWDDQGLTVPGLQLVGCKCHVFPKSPDPDPSIKEWV
jgi:hypothetical protein